MNSPCTSCVPLIQCLSGYSISSLGSIGEDSVDFPILRLLGHKIMMILPFVEKVYLTTWIFGDGFGMYQNYLRFLPPAPGTATRHTSTTSHCFLVSNKPLPPSTPSPTVFYILHRVEWKFSGCCILYPAPGSNVGPRPLGRPPGPKGLLSRRFSFTLTIFFVYFFCRTASVDMRQRCGRAGGAMRLRLGGRLQGYVLLPATQIPSGRRDTV